MRRSEGKNATKENPKTMTTKIQSAAEVAIVIVALMIVGHMTASGHAVAIANDLAVGTGDAGRAVVSEDDAAGAAAGIAGGTGGANPHVAQRYVFQLH